MCNKDVGVGHKCTKCNSYIHPFCGITQGEEGYGKPIICQICMEDGKLTFDNHFE